MKDRATDDFCPGCGDGDKVPAGYFLCPVCDAEWGDDEVTPASGADGQGPIAAQTADDASGIPSNPSTSEPSNVQ